MKDLLEIHNEIKNLEAIIKLMSSVINVSDDEQKELIRLEKLSIELSDVIKTVKKDIKDLQEKNKQEHTICDYDVICTLAEEIPFKHHPLVELKDCYLCKLYIGLLVNIAGLGRDRDFDLTQMGFIQWILNKSSFDGTMEEIIQSCHEFDKEKLNNINEYLSDDYKKYLIIDALMVVNLNGNREEKALEFIISLCAMFGLRKEEVEAVSIISNTALAQNIHDMEKTQLKKIMPYLNKVKHYIYSDMFRYIVMDLPYKDRAYDFKWEVKKQGQYVKKGEFIASYYNIQRKRIEIITDISGYLFFFTGKTGRYAVISQKEDNVAQIKEWLNE